MYKIYWLTKRKHCDEAKPVMQRDGITAWVCKHDIEESSMSDLSKKMGECVGHASTCWSNLKGAGEFDSSEAGKVTDKAVVIAQEHARSEVLRFAQHLKDNGFCPDTAFSQHVMDCYDTFDKEPNS